MEGSRYARVEEEAADEERPDGLLRRQLPAREQGLPDLGRDSAPEVLMDRGAPPRQSAVAAPESGLSREPEADGNTRAYINDLLENPESSITAGIIHYFIIFVILASTGCVILETVPELSLNPIFFPVEMCITAIFTMEFALRLYACDSLKAFTSNCFNVIDFLAIFPGYVDLLILLLRTSESNRHVNKAADSMRTLRMIRIVRLVRVFRVMRLAKVARHSQLLNIIVAVFFKVAQSGLVIVLMLMCFAMVLSASLIYLSESEVCETTGYHCTGPSAFVSIPSSFWWAVATLTTVGYGDMVPHTMMGKVVGGFTAVAGVMVIAIGVALVSINFRECFIEEKAKVHNRRRGLNMSLPETRHKESKVLEELLNNFDESSLALLARLQTAAARQDEGGSQQLAAMLDMLTAHRSMLKTDVQVFMRRALQLQLDVNIGDLSPIAAPHGTGNGPAAAGPAVGTADTSPAATNGGHSPAAWIGT